MNIEIKTEELILQSAEKEFVTKGFNNATTTSIAQTAGVTQAMVNYYYRTKENLFRKVFHNKVQKIADAFEMAFLDNVLFEDIIRSFIEKHFDFVTENPKLMSFVYNEITSNAESRKLVLEVIAPKVKHILEHLEKSLEAEMAKGTIRPVKIVDLMMNIASMNLISVAALPVMNELMHNQSDEYYANFLEERKESNVQFILNALYIHTPPLQCHCELDLQSPGVTQVKTITVQKKLLIKKKDDKK